MGMFGADIQQLRQTAVMMSSNATQIQEIARRLTAKIEGTTAWRGNDAEKFKAEWSSESLPTLIRSVHFLSEASGSLTHHADEQQDASDDDGGGSSALGGPAPSSAASTNDKPVKVPTKMDAEDAAAWWKTLTDAQRRDLIKNQPDLIGNLDGLPGWARDKANRIRLDTEELRLSAEYAGANSERREQIYESLKALDSVRAALDVKGKQTQLLLLNLDNGGQPKAAIAVGDVDTADHVSMVVPGISTTVGKDMARYVTGMSDLQDRSKALMLAEGQSGKVANIAWLGYDFPTGLSSDIGRMATEIPTTKAAANGGRWLASFADGLNFSRSDDFHLTALGHSYGSLTTGLAVQQSSAFDSVVFFGSPGIGTNNIADIQVPPSQVFVMEAKKDFVADLGWFSGDPNHMQGVTNLYTGASQYGSQVTGHVDYLTHQSTSQYNMAAVVTGNSDLALHGTNNGIGDILGGALGGGQRIIDGGVNDGLDGVVRGVESNIGSIVEGVSGTIQDGGRRLGEAWDDLWRKK